MADTSPARDRWTPHRSTPEPRSIVELIRDGMLDPELAATVWLLVEARVPVIVAADERGSGRSTLMRAILDFVPPRVERIELAGAEETFAWLPQATELGWHARPGSGDRDIRSPVRSSPVRPDATMLVAADLSDDLPTSTWGEAARIAIRAATIGYGLAASIRADGLDEVLDRLARPPVSASDDELSRIGVVLIIRRPNDERPRVVAAHYLRPTARDEHGHVQRLGPAVLATWDPIRDRFEHFGWGITPELAIRVGRKAGDFELELERRRELIGGLLAAGVMDVATVRAALADGRP